MPTTYHLKVKRINYIIKSANSPTAMQKLKKILKKTPDPAFERREKEGRRR